MKNNLWILFLVFFVSGCADNMNESVFFVSHPILSPATTDSSFNYAGVLFNFTNNSSKTISGLEVSFTVFDKATCRNPFYTSNYITGTITNEILPHEERSFEISLDDKTHYLTPDSLFIDYFTVNKIIYEDGSVWTNLWIPSSSHKKQ